MDDKLKMLDLHLKLQECGLDYTDLENMQTEFLDSRKNVADIEADVTREITYDAFKVSPPLTQSGMNILAYADYDIAEAKLNRAIAEYKLYLDEREAGLFDEAQRAWERFADLEAHQRVAMFEGGSMQPSIYAMERLGLAISRIAELRAQIKYRSKLDAD